VDRSPTAAAGGGTVIDAGGCTSAGHVTEISKPAIRVGCAGRTASEASAWENDGRRLRRRSGWGIHGHRRIGGGDARTAYAATLEARVAAATRLAKSAAWHAGSAAAADRAIHIAGVAAATRQAITAADHAGAAAAAKQAIPKAGVAAATRLVLIAAVHAGAAAADRVPKARVAAATRLAKTAAIQAGAVAADRVRKKAGVAAATRLARKATGGWRRCLRHRGARRVRRRRGARGGVGWRARWCGCRRCCRGVRHRRCVRVGRGFGRRSRRASAYAEAAAALVVTRWRFLSARAFQARAAALIGQTALPFRFARRCPRQARRCEKRRCQENNGHQELLHGCPPVFFSCRRLSDRRAAYVKHNRQCHRVRIATADCAGTSTARAMGRRDDRHQRRHPTMAIERRCCD